MNDMKNEKFYTKLVKDAFNANVADLAKKVDKVIAMKANVLLNKKQSKMFNEIFK